MCRLKPCEERWLALGFPAWQTDGLLEEFAMYRRGEAAGVESGMLEALSRTPNSFGEFARDYAPTFSLDMSGSNVPSMQTNSPASESSSQVAARELARPS